MFNGMLLNQLSTYNLWFVSVGKILAQTYNDIAASFNIRLIWFALVIFFTTEELKTITKARHSIQYENLKNPIWVASLDFIVWWSAFL